ncbi:MAG TPA: phosphoribosylaminoimidazolesuccinocarboxamide synthase [Pirellulales bacterium]|nr:phosphoribosylaminoimidazolesuccinocarboxamide synthase [Pirellulales bacterium]
MPPTVVLETYLSPLRVRRGKVRDVYDLGDSLLLVATDRISAFDWVLPSGIPDKGRILTQLSRFWFELLGEPNHLITCDVDQMPLPADVDRGPLAGRTMLVRKTQVVPIECVARGYLSGSGWKEYTRHGTVCGIRLPGGLVESDELAEPIFTPATKAESGHDENISFEVMCETVGRELAEELRRRTLEVYRQGSQHARRRGIIIADTKFEWGLVAEEGRQKVLLIDEALTPDSSRFWPANEYQPGRGQPSYDKQYVRDWLEASGWDKQSPPPALPDDVVARTRAKYVEAYETLTGQRFS